MSTSARIDLIDGKGDRRARVGIQANRGRLPRHARIGGEELKVRVETVQIDDRPLGPNGRDADAGDENSGSE